ncbi:MAG: hypothetical protein ACPLN2_07465 [Thermoproteota archaeon]
MIFDYIKFLDYSLKKRLCKTRDKVKTSLKKRFRETKRRTCLYEEVSDIRRNNAKRRVESFKLG